MGPAVRSSISRDLRSALLAPAALRRISGNRLYTIFIPMKSIIAALLCAVSAHAAALVSGSATIDYDKAAWDQLAADLGAAPPVLTLDEFFDQAAANARNYNQVLHDEVQANPAYTGQVYTMNGPTVTNLLGRTTQPTTFNYTPGNPQGHTGAIGLGGIARFAVSAAAGGGKLLYGDFTLLYDAGRIDLGGTGWYLKGNIAPSAAAFDILNVVVTETANTLTISGDLGVTYELANLLYSTPADAGRDVGNFTFTAQVTVPEPAVGSTAILAALGLCARRRRKTTGG